MAQAATRYRHLAEMAIEFLETAGQPQPAQTLTTRLLGESAARQTAFVRLVEQLLDEDARFCRDAAGRWALAGWERGDLALPLAQQEFAVVDVETTGGRKERHRIVEVAVVKVRDGRITEHYESLVNPQRPLPQFITDLTGITQEMVECAPTADGVLLEARAFIGDLVLVGHNVACDLTFLNYEALWHGLPPFGNPALDTEELALRLLPDLRRPSLRRVAATLGLPQPVRHRAFADARLAAGILLELLRRLDGVAGTPIDTFGQLQDWLASRLVERQARVRRVRAVLPAGTLDALPEQPGVYTFRDAEGRALYVGKAASLRDRVAQHFSGTARALRREDGLLERTAAVEHEVAGCELDALLLESERIRTHQPPYNVQERSRRGCPFLRFEAGVLPRVAAAQQVTAETLYAGPYHTTQAVRHTIQTLRRVFQLRSCRRILPAKRAAMRVPCLRLGQGLCPAPCAELVTPEQYAVLVEFARLFVTAGKLATLEALDARLATLEREGAAEGWEYRTLREIRLRLWRIRREHRPIDGGLAGDDLLMAYPAADGGATLFFVRDGRLMRRVRIPAGHADRACLIPVIEQCLRADGPEAEAPLDADQANIVLRWIYRHTGRPELIPITSETSVSDVGAAVEGVLGT